MKEPEINAGPITIYNSVHVRPGERLPERFTFSFGCDPDGLPADRLFDLGESEIVEQILANPLLCHRLLEPLGAQYPHCWMVSEILTRDAAGSWPNPLPGDLDIVCGGIIGGRADFDLISCVQVKIRKVKTFDQTGQFASGSGTKQSYWTARMGFDRTLLLHCIVRIPQPLPAGYAPGWSTIVNADFERAAGACFGTIREKFKRDRELYGYGWIGWGHAFGSNWNTCGSLAVDLVYPPPFRPLDSAEGRQTREEMAASFRDLIAQQDTGNPPVIVRRKRR
jgi:hypothetical protein